METRGSLSRKQGTAAEQADLSFDVTHLLRIRVAIDVILCLKDFTYKIYMLKPVQTDCQCQPDSVAHYKSCHVNTAIIQSRMIFEVSLMSWGIGHVLFAITKSYRISQSACRSPRLMAFQVKQAQGYTLSIHKIL